MKNEHAWNNILNQYETHGSETLKNGPFGEEGAISMCATQPHRGAI